MKVTIFKMAFLLCFGLVITGNVSANEIEIVAAKAIRAADGTYRFDVTLLHEDAGWDHYANKWEIRTEEGDVLGTRILHHPHDAEQPFTRSLSGVRIPEGVKSVFVYATDSKHGLSNHRLEVRLNR